MKNPPVDRMIDDLLICASPHALETDDFDAFMAGAEWGARRVVRQLAETLWVSLEMPPLPEMSE